MDHSSSNSSDPKILHIGTGVVVDQQTILWEIKGFNHIMKHDILINSQRIEFTAGVGIGQTSKWSAWFQAKVKDGKKVMYILYNITEPPTNPDSTLYSQLTPSASLKPFEHDGTETWTQPEVGPIRNISDMKTKETGWNIAMITLPEENHRYVVDLELKLTHTIYSAQKQTGGETVPARLAQFQLGSTAKARKVVSGLVMNPEGLGSEVKIRSRDDKEFTIPRGVLVARSPMFAAMFRNDMLETNGGLLELPDITGKSLGILLNFIFTGELLPGWMEGGVILELTNAAAKYQLQNLLEFLDTILGDICELENALPLLTLAHQLGLKTAEEELLKFIREKGAKNTENLFKVINAMPSPN